MNTIVRTMGKWWVLVTLFSLMLSWAVPAAPAAAAGEPLTLTGLVTDTAGRPIGGALAQVVLGDGRVIGQAMTDPAGRFRITAPLAGEDVFRVQVWAEGFRLGTTPWRGAWDRRELEVRLTRWGGRIEGVVTDLSGLPAPGATVELRAAGGRVVARATAGEAGRYALDAPPGTWQLTGEAGGLPLAAQPVTVTDGGLVHLDLKAAPLQVRITGQVLDAVTGKPVGGARVEVHRAGLGLIAAATAVRPEGRFTLAVPPVGTAELTLRVTLPGYRLLETEPFAAPAGQDLDFSGSKALRVHPLTATVTGVLTGLSGSPIANTDLWVEVEGAGIVRTGRTDPDGRFRIEGLPAGESIRYRVRAQGVGYRVASSDWFTLKGGEVRPLALIAQHLSRPDASYLVPVTITGRVVDPAGYPVAGAEVTLYQEGSNFKVDTKTSDLDGIVRFQVYMDAGAAGFGYRVRAERTGYFPTEDLAGSDEDVLRLGGDLTALFTVTLRPEWGRLSGRVLGAQGRPLPGATVRLLRLDGSPAATATTGGDGRYEFTGLPATGYPAYVVMAEAPGYFPAALAPLAAAGEQVVPDLTLRPARGQVRGRVTGPGGVPLAGVKVRAAVPGAEPAETVTGADGTWRLPDLPAGVPVTFTYSAAGYHTVTSIQDALAPGDDRRLEVALFPAAACLTGRASTPAGAPLAGVRVRLFQEGKGLLATVTTGADGSFRFEGLATLSGWYALQADAAGYRPALPGTGLFPLLPEPGGGCARQDLWLAPAD